MAKLLILIAGYFLLNNQILLLVTANRNNITFTKCCPNKMLYKIGFDECHPGGEENFSSWPPVFDRLNNRLIDDVTADDFILTTAESLDNCTEGEVAVSSTQFRFFSDGSLRLDDGRRFKSGEFCLNQIPAPAVFTARFCIRDPCNETAGGCLRKCCPNGMAVNNTDRLCHPTTLPFQVDFKDENGQSVELSPSAYIVRDGVAPKCNINGYNPLSEKYGDVFYVLPSGQIYIPIYPEGDRATPEYCIDNFVGNGEPPVIILTNSLSD